MNSSWNAVLHTFFVNPLSLNLPWLLLHVRRRGSIQSFPSTLKSQQALSIGQPNMLFVIALTQIHVFWSDAPLKMTSSVPSKTVKVKKNPKWSCTALVNIFQHRNKFGGSKTTAWIKITYHFVKVGEQPMVMLRELNAYISVLICSPMLAAEPITMFL